MNSAFILIKSYCFTDPQNRSTYMKIETIRSNLYSIFHIIIFAISQNAFIYNITIIFDFVSKWSKNFVLPYCIFSSYFNVIVLIYYLERQEDVLRKVQKLMFKIFVRTKWLVYITCKNNKKRRFYLMGIS